MFQTIALRDDKKGYVLYKPNLPKEFVNEPIIFLPELSSRNKNLKYFTKFTHISGNIIIKLVRSDGLDPFGRPKSLAYALLVPPEEYNFNSLYYYLSPLITSDKFAVQDMDPEPLKLEEFQKHENKILEKVDIKTLREIVVAAMIEPHVVIEPNLDEEGLLELTAVIDKSIPFEASYDFSLISYSDVKFKKILVHNIQYFYGKRFRIGREQHGVELRTKRKEISNIAKREADYLDEYIETIVKEDYEKLLAEHANWLIGRYHNEHKELQLAFTKRYQLDMPFSRRNKIYKKIVESMAKIHGKY